MNQMDFLPSDISEISFTEKFFCRTEISSVPLNEWHDEKPPVGKIEIRVPYNVWRGLIKDTLRNSLSITRSQRIITAFRVSLINLFNGSSNDFKWNDLKLRKYKFTDLGSRLYLRPGISLFPLRKILEQAVQEQHSSNQLDAIDRSITIEYLPDNPRPLPLTIDLKVLDEREVDDQRSFQLISQKDYENNRLSEEVAKKIKEQARFEGSFIFEFQCALKMRRGKKLNFEDPPKVKRMSLKWPGFVSPHRLNLLVLGDELLGNWPITFDAEKSAITWFNVPFSERVSKELSSSINLSDEIEIKTPPVQLRIPSSIDLYQQSKEQNNLDVFGEIEIEIPFLLSGLEFVNTSDFKLRIKQQTLLTSDLLINLEDQFEKKIFSPYQHLQFPNVLLDEMRLADITMLLQDMQFQVWSENMQSDQDEIIQKSLVTARRSEGAGVLKLWIVVEGEKYGTTREKRIPGSEKFTTAFSSGKTNVYIRGELKGDTYRVVQVINNFHDRLKTRFRHVNTVD